MTALLASDGVRLHYTEHGDPQGRPLVLLAGFLAPATSWCYQMDAFPDHRVIAVDLRGHGEAEHPETGTDMDRRGDDVHEVLSALGLEGAVLVGGSMGGNTIWSTLLRHGATRLAGVVIVDQTPKMLNAPDWPHGFYGYDASNADTFFAERIPETGHGTPLWKRGRRLVRLMRAMGGAKKELGTGDLALLKDHAHRDWRPVIAGCPVPALFVAGAESEFWPASHAAASAALAPHGSSAVIDNDGHAANIEQPEAFNRLLGDFLSALP